MKIQNRLATTTIALAIVLTLAIPALAQNGPRGNGSNSGLGIARDAAPLTTEEIQWLTYMREEEKLARDVYRQLYEKWNVVIFQNISESEDRHTEAVARKLEQYGLPDPAATLPAGVYANPDLTSLYAALMEKGTRSLVDALEVGVLIEETDIDDIGLALAATRNTGIARVYSNLLNGSLNHLEAFENALDTVWVAAQAN